MKNKNWKTALCWVAGTVLTFATVLVILLVLMAKVYDIQPEDLSGFINTWLSLAVVIAFLPPLAAAIVVDDELARHLEEVGIQMILYGNAVAWVFWIVMLVIAVLFICAFREELLGSADGDQLPEPVYRRVLGSIKGILLALSIMILPNKDGEVSD